MAQRKRLAVFFPASASSVAVALFCTLMLSACAIGNEYSYETKAALPYTGTGRVAATVHDQRPYVISGNKPASFVGLQRNRFGIPFDVSTTSGKPLDQDLTKTLVNSLVGAGYSPVVAVTSGALDSAATLRSRLQATKPQRSLLLTVDEWKTDTKTKAALYYALTLSVFDERGKLLASQSVKGRDNIGGKSFGTEAYVNEQAPQAFANQLITLFNTPDVMKAMGRKAP